MAPISTDRKASDDRSGTAERRIRWVGAATLAAIMAGHVLLETARDALFLAHVSVERLPFVTIAVAALALGFARSRERRSDRAVLLVLQATAALGTVAFWLLTATGQTWSYYALYVWSGVITGLVVVRFWLVLAELVTITQGKRLFAAIAMGGSVGALVGSAVAAALAPVVGGAGLLLLSAGAFGLSALGPFLSLGTGGDAAEPVLPRESEAEAGLTASLRDVFGSPYALRVALLVVVGGMTLTFGDYLFKSVLTEEVAAEDLATWLSRIYFGLNVLSIAMLAVGVTPLVRVLGVDRSLAVLPALVLLAGLGVLAGGALVATIALKVADGTLRYSLHKTASELLYLPMTSSLRTAVKGTIDIVGQTGAKALASLLILGLLVTPVPQTLVAAAVVVLAATWVVAALGLRRVYLDVFRRTLREKSIETWVEHPELDLQSAGSLLRALGDPDERRVLAALRLLAERGCIHLVSTLILYHPSPVVVATALDLFALEGREDLPQMLERLVDHEDANVRAAAVRAYWVSGVGVDRLEALGDSECLVVRFSAAAGRLVHGQIDVEPFRAVLDEVLVYEEAEARLAAATAARLRYHPVYRDPLVRMATDPDAAVAREAILAIRSSRDDWFTAPLVDLLGERRIREEVRRALIERGEEALAVLAARLVHPEVPIALLRHVPRTLARFGSREAAGVLVQALGRIESGMVRYKILRGLETLQRERQRGGRAEAAALTDADGMLVRREFHRTLDRSLELLKLEAVLAAGREDGSETTVGAELLVELLEDKRMLATRRLFMMLGLLYPREDFRIIREGLGSADAKSRSSAQELVETLLSHDVSNAILGLEMPGSAAARLAVADPAGRREAIEYTSAVRLLLKDDSGSVRAVALYHAAELGIDCGKRDLERIPTRGRRASLQEQALELLRDLTQQGARASLMGILAR